MDAAFKEAHGAVQRAERQEPDWKKIYEDFSDVPRATQNLWFRFTEAGFDDFMQAQKL